MDYKTLDYMETLSEELSLNGLSTIVRHHKNKIYLRMETIAGNIKYEKAFNDVMKDYYRFIRVYGDKLSSWALQQQNLIH